MSYPPRSSAGRTPQDRAASTEAAANAFKSAEEAIKFLQTHGYTEATRKATEYDVALMIEQVGVALSDISRAHTQVKTLYAIAHCLRMKTHTTVVSEMTGLWERDSHERAVKEREGNERRESEEWKETKELLSKLVDITETSARENANAIRELTTSMNTMLEKPTAPNAPNLDQPHLPAGQPSYAQAAASAHQNPTQPQTSQPIPPIAIAKPPPQLARQHITRRQVLIDWDASIFAGQGPPIFNEAQWKDHANKAFETIAVERENEEDELIPPVRAVTKLQNGGIVFEFTTDETAQRTRDHAASFCQALPGVAWSVKARLWTCRIRFRFVPTSFDPDDEESIQRLATGSGLPRGDIAQAKWMKKPELRHSKQVVANLLVKFTSAGAANTAIRHDVFLEGKRLKVDILDPEPLRCLNCQLLDPGHLANTCPNPVACGHCGHVHQTTQCPDAQNPRQVRCLNCKKQGHASWDRTCPQFKKRAEQMKSQRPSSNYRYYVTDEPWTWQSLWDDATRQTTPVPPPNNSTQANDIHAERRRAFITGEQLWRMGEENTRPPRNNRRPRSGAVATGSNAIPQQAPIRQPPANASERPIIQARLERFRGFTQTAGDASTSRDTRQPNQQNQAPPGRINSPDDLYI